MEMEFKTFKEWMLHQFEHNELADLCNHGAQGGFSGLIYYHETTALYNQYHEDIWEMLYDDAESLGIHCLELVATFGGARDVHSDAQYKNLLIWYAAEKIADEVTQGEYQSDDDSNDSDGTD